MNHLFLDALKGQDFEKRPPIWLMRQAGRYMASYQTLRAKHSFQKLCHEPDLIHQVTLLPVKELDVDAAILFSDILLVLEAIGFDVQFIEKKGPVITNSLQHPSEINNLTKNPNHTPFLIEAIQTLKKDLPIPLIGFAGAPFTLASYLIEGQTSRSLEKTKAWSYRHPSEFKQLIDALTEVVIQHLRMQADAGCDALQIFDSWAFVLTDAHFEKWCLDPLKKIISALKTENKTPLIYFCKGSSHWASQIAQTGIQAISLDWTQPIKNIRNKVPRLTLQGNLDPCALHLPQNLLQQEIHQIVQSMKNDPAFIFNLGHGILPDVPYENVRFLVDTIKNPSPLYQ